MGGRAILGTKRRWRDTLRTGRRAGREPAPQKLIFWAAAGTLLLMQPEAYLAIERFLKASRRPVVMEPGEDPLPLLAGSFQLGCQGQIVTLEVWSETRNLVRRVRRLHLEQR